MTNWIHRFFNPHCPHCMDEMKESKVCASCETLREQLASTIHEKNRLLDRLLVEPIKEVAKDVSEITRPLNVPWTVRKQMLEREDREKARLMASAPVAKISTEDLEKDLDLAGTIRESEAK